eukprot:GSChrysophyteH1.ASY1.ANO1.2651.1 assembled CDS
MLGAKLIVLLVVFAVCRAGSEDLIMKPKSNSLDKTAAIILAPGFGIDADAYAPLGAALQDAFANQGINLWLGGAISKIGKKLTEAGLPEDHSTFYSGHSVGGALMPYMLKDVSKLPFKPDGMILMAAFLVRAFREKSVPEVGPGQYVFENAPVLSIGAELDGLARMTRFAEAYNNQITLSTDPAAAKKTLPVTMIKGMTHMQFASGTPPSEVVKRDLLPEISYEAAHAAVAADSAAFAAGILQNDWSALDKRVSETQEFLQPMVDLMNLEGYHQFKPPCYCEELDEYGGLEYGTCPEQPGCTAGSPWTARAQQLMINPDYESGKGLLMNGAPTLCSSPDTCTLTANTITQLLYEDGSEIDFWRIDIGNDNVDTGYYPITASEMKSKMKSHQSILQAANDTAAIDMVAGSTFDDLDDPKTGHCSAINQIAIETALNAVSEQTRERYMKFGQKMVTAEEDKKVCIAGPCWIWAPLEYKGRNKDGDVTINPPSFAFKNENPYPCDEKLYPKDDRKVVLPCTAGMHYCKLLSPARVAEWIHVDSLRLNYSLKSQKKAE